MSGVSELNNKIDTIRDNLIESDKNLEKNISDVHKSLHDMIVSGGGNSGNGLEDQLLELQTVPLELNDLVTFDEAMARFKSHEHVLDKLSGKKKAHLFIKLMDLDMIQHRLIVEDLMQDIVLKKKMSVLGERLPSLRLDWAEDLENSEFLLRVFENIDQSELNTEEVTNFACALHSLKANLLSAKCKNMTPGTGLIGRYGPPISAIRIESFSGSDWFDFYQGPISRAVNGLPLGLPENERVMVNVILSLQEQFSAMLSYWKEAHSNGLYPHVIDWAPELYWAKQGDDLPPYANVAPPEGTYSYWEPIHPDVRMPQRANYSFPRWNTSADLSSFLAFFKDRSDEIYIYKSEYLDAMSKFTNSINAISEWVDSDEYLSTMIYSNRAGIPTVFGEMKEFTRGENTFNGEEISKSLYELSILKQTSYFGTGNVWTLKRKENAVKADTVQNVANNYDFFEDTSDSNVIDKLYETAENTLNFYNDMIEVSIDSYELEDKDVLDAPNFTEKKKIVSAKDAINTSDVDAFGPTGFLSDAFFAKGYTVYEYNKSDWDNYDRDPSFNIREVTSLADCDLSSTSTKKYYPNLENSTYLTDLKNKDAPYVYVDSDLVNPETGNLDIITTNSGTWTGFLTSQCTNLIPDHGIIGSIFGLVIPTKAEYLSLIPDSTPKMYYDNFGYYAARIHHIWAIMRYKNWVHYTMNPKLMLEREINFFKDAKYIVCGGVFNPYGTAQLASKVTVDGVDHEGVVLTMETRRLIYNLYAGTVVSLGVLHEFLSGHSLVLPRQDSIKAEQLKEGKITRVRKHIETGGHMEGFTNAVEAALGVDLGAYNKIIDFEADGQSVILSETETEPFVVASALMTASRLGPRAKFDIRQGWKSRETTTVEAWNGFSDDCGWDIDLVTGFSSRFNAGSLAQNTNYMPGAIFLTAAKKYYEQLLGDKFDLKQFFQASVVELVQPAPISAMTKALENWAKSL